ncbi:MAG: HPr family phosphocarrier protein [Eubacteriales bacterium]|nr:HPr family phosphocarrier protein [Eubacteriales bacterium]MDD3074451.1 HPr family phosphocarrier protein [Eubacteriales bacterium]MDD4079440.1 HPr family phosphocarrier protein [Eubacteriales bacterium]MDD4769383.1 HPr family phosphocarrier protein [Eubacteriales bacterium]
MAEKTVTVTNKAGLHARTAAVIVQKAQEFTSDISIIRDAKEVSAKSIMGIMTLGISQGTAITIKAEGKDASQAVAALAQLVQAFADM